MHPHVGTRGLRRDVDAHISIEAHFKAPRLGLHRQARRRRQHTLIHACMYAPAGRHDVDSNIIIVWEQARPPIDAITSSGLGDYWVTTG
jgi:hypothetical protein